MTLSFPDRYEHLRFAVKHAPSGVGIEFGVYSGRTLEIIRDNQAGPVLGFDSFRGLPETWRAGFEQGHFATSRIPVLKDAAIVVGAFEDTLPGVIGHLDRPISFVHFDADLYSSTIFALEEITAYLAERCVFVFDEYANYPGWQEHEYLAFHEWQRDHQNFTVTPIGRVPSHQQASFDITRK